LLSGILAHQANRVEEVFTPRFQFRRFQRGDWMLMAGISGNGGEAVLPEGQVSHG